MATCLWNLDRHNYFVKKKSRNPDEPNTAKSLAIASSLYTGVAFYADYLYASLKLRRFPLLRRTFYTPLNRKYFYKNRETSTNFTK